MNWYAYEIPPIDFGWEHIKTVKQTLTQLIATDNVIGENNDVNAGSIRAFLDRWQQAKKAATESGWEGDFRHEPCVFWLPSDTELVYGFVFKQDNNGTTYVVSPERLPWLEKWNKPAVRAKLS